MSQICVLGAGIAGLETAIEIQRIEPRAKVSLLADEFSPNITSAVAGGHWLPAFLSDKRTHLVNRWAQRTFEHWERLAHEDGAKYGAQMYSGYEFSDEPIVMDCSFMLPVFKRLTTQEAIKKSASHQYRYGVFYTTAQIQAETYLSHLMQQFIQQGGMVQRRHVEKFSDVASEYGIIVNCCSLGSRVLCNDERIHPIRGQVFRVHAPHVKHFAVYENIQGNYTRYFLPNKDFLVVGGTVQVDDWNLAWSEQDGRDIWSDVQRYMPSIRDCPIVGKKVGLRPGRPEIRLESENMQSDKGPIHIVHNYGHGGSGWTLSKGCAEDAATLAVQAAHKYHAKL